MRRELWYLFLGHLLLVEEGVRCFSVRPQEAKGRIKKRVSEPTVPQVVLGRRELKAKQLVPTPGADAVEGFLKNPYYEVFSFFGVLMSCAVYAIGTLELDLDTLRYLEYVGNSISAVVALEWFLRFYSRGFDSRYLIEPLPVVDFLSFITLAPWIDGNLTFLRLLRILRFQRILVDVETFSLFRQALSSPWTGNSVALPHASSSSKKTTTKRPRKKRKNRAWGRYTLKSRPIVDISIEKEATDQLVFDRVSRMREETVLKVARFVTTVFTLLFVASGCIYSAEHDVNGENFPDFFSALYFGLTTLTTVGFGDIVPVTPNGRLVVSFSILVGIAIIPAQVSSLAEAILVSANLDMMERNRLPGVSRLEKREEIPPSKKVWDDRASLDTTRLQLYLEPEDVEFDDFEQKVNMNSLRVSSSARGQRRKRQRYMNGDDLAARSKLPPPCTNCGEKAHFKDATFCFRCGNSLSPSSVGVSTSSS